MEKSSVRVDLAVLDDVLSGWWLRFEWHDWIAGEDTDPLRNVDDETGFRSVLDASGQRKPTETTDADISKGTSPRIGIVDVRRVENDFEGFELGKPVQPFG